MTLGLNSLYSNALSLSRLWRQPSAQVASIACFPLWLKICHRHIFLTRRAHPEGALGAGLFSLFLRCLKGAGGGLLQKSPSHPRLRTLVLALSSSLTQKSLRRASAGMGIKDRSGEGPLRFRGGPPRRTFPPSASRRGDWAGDCSGTPWNSCKRPW